MKNIEAPETAAFRPKSNFQLKGFRGFYDVDIFFPIISAVSGTIHGFESSRDGENIERGKERRNEIG